MHSILVCLGNALIALLIAFHLHRNHKCLIFAVKTQPNSLRVHSRELHKSTSCCCCCWYMKVRRETGVFSRACWHYSCWWKPYHSCQYCHSGTVVTVSYGVATVFYWPLTRNSWPRFWHTGTGDLEGKHVLINLQYGRRDKETSCQFWK